MNRKSDDFIKEMMDFIDEKIDEKAERESKWNTQKPSDSVVYPDFRYSVGSLNQAHYILQESFFNALSKRQQKKFLNKVRQKLYNANKIASQQDKMKSVATDEMAEYIKGNPAIYDICIPATKLYHQLDARYVPFSGWDYESLKKGKLQVGV